MVAEAQNTQTEPVGITFESAAAANSDLTMALDATAANPFFAGGSLSTSLGLLTITGAQNLSFVSVPASAPEPGTLGLGSLAGLGPTSAPSGFLSYRSANAPQAEWLHRKLESYFGSARTRLLGWGARHLLFSPLQNLFTKLAHLFIPRKPLELNHFPKSLRKTILRRA